MNKPSWNILIYILISFGCSQKITVEENETFYDESNGTFYDELNKTFYDELNGTAHDESNETFYSELKKPSKNLTTIGYEIVHFNNKNVQVRNTLSIIFYLHLLR